MKPNGQSTVGEQRTRSTRGQDALTFGRSPMAPPSSVCPGRPPGFWFAAPRSALMCDIILALLLLHTRQFSEEASYRGDSLLPTAAN